LSFGDSSYIGKKPSFPHPRIGALSALKILADAIGKPMDQSAFRIINGGLDDSVLLSNCGVSLDDIPWKFTLLQVNGTLRLANNIIIRTDDHWFDAHVDASTGQIHALFDWASNSNFEVYGIPNTDPLLGTRVTLASPEMLPYSPLGWNCQTSSNCTTTTVGNNVWSQTNPTGGNNWINNYRPNAGADLNFVFPIDFTMEPDKYKDAVVTNLFYWNNLIHDIFYAAGFVEEAGNFQENNFNFGGKGQDAVQANAQDGSGYNNANFLTPPDGQRPRMRMYLWNAKRPMRDGDLDSGIIVHEYGHGISNRLTGGPSNVNCLQKLQSGGMGEGWSDWWAICFQMKQTAKGSDAFPMGAYANFGKGIRAFPYSTDFKVDPQTFGYLNQNGYTTVHPIGSVWCTILNEVYWEFVNKYGFDPDWYKGEAGNNVIFQNVVDGLKLQPCNPSFIDARNAIMLADSINYDGDHECDLWRSFARRGLGTNAESLPTGKVVESFSIPPECQ